MLVNGISYLYSLNSLFEDLLIQKDVSYASSANTKYVISSEKKNDVESCSSLCAITGDNDWGCNRFTWQSNNRTCWLFRKDDDLAITYEFGSYSGVPRGRGKLNLF